MPMKTIGASMSGNSSVWRWARAAMPNTTSAIIVTTVMIGRRMAKSEMNILSRGTATDGPTGDRSLPLSTRTPRCTFDQARVEADHAVYLASVHLPSRRGTPMLRTWSLAISVVTAAIAPVSAQSVQYQLPSGVYRSLADTGPVARAQQAPAAHPRSVQRFIQLGVAQSGARQMREAVQTFTRAIAIAPNDPMLYRWRGHRNLSVRDFDGA